MDSLGLVHFCDSSKIRDMVNLILEQNPSHLVVDEVRGMVGIAGLKKHVGVDGTLEDTEDEVSASFHSGVTGDGTPHFHCIVEVCVFGRGLLIFTLPGIGDTLCPGVTVEPVKGTPGREVGVLSGGVAGVTDECVDVVLVVVNPGG